MQETADLVTFTEEILNEKTLFCAGTFKGVRFQQIKELEDFNYI